jgi:hypothetical protein
MPLTPAEPAPFRPPRKVWMAPDLMEQVVARDIRGYRLRWDWGKPDADGFYTPTITIDYADKLGWVEP